MGTIGNSTEAFDSTALPVPSGGSAGDISVAATFDVTAIAGFTQRVTLTHEGFQVRLWTKTRTGSEGTNYTMTSGGTVPCGICVNLIGVQEAPTTGTGQGTGTTATAPSVAAAGIMLAFYVVGSGESTITAGPGTMTLIQILETNNIALYGQNPVTDPTGTRAATLSPSNPWSAISAVFVDTGGGGGGVANPPGVAGVTPRRALLSVGTQPERHGAIWAFKGPAIRRAA